MQAMGRKKTSSLLLKIQIWPTTAKSRAKFALLRKSHTSWNSVASARDKRRKKLGVNSPGRGDFQDSCGPSDAKRTCVHHGLLRRVQQSRAVEAWESNPAGDGCSCGKNDGPFQAKLRKLVERIGFMGLPLTGVKIGVVDALDKSGLAVHL